MLIALKGFGDYHFDEFSRVGHEGMPLVVVGRSGVKFRETAKTCLSERVKLARGKFAELEDFDWPERGSAAELDSLLFQASRFRETQRPTNLEAAVSELFKEYPKSVQPSCLKGEWDREGLKAKIQKVAQTEVKADSSPGVPFAILGTTNGAVLQTNLQLVVEAAYARLELLGRIELDESWNWKSGGR